MPSEDEKADTGSDFELEEPAKGARSPRGMRSPRKERSLPVRSPRARSPGPQRNGSDSDIVWLQKDFSVYIVNTHINNNGTFWYLISRYKLRYAYSNNNYISIRKFMIQILGA